MRSRHERFWSEHRCFAVIGDVAKRNFPTLTYHALKQRGKQVVAIDPTLKTIEGDPVHASFETVTEAPDAAVLEVPRQETAAWIERIAEAGIRAVWIHMGRETPEALRAAGELGVRVLHGNCAVMYLTPGFTYHSVHRWIVRAMGRY